MKKQMFNPKYVLPTRGVPLEYSVVESLRNSEYFYGLVEVVLIEGKYYTIDGNHRFTIANERGQCLEGILIEEGDEGYREIKESIKEFRNSAINEGYITYDDLVKEINNGKYLGTIP